MIAREHAATENHFVTRRLPWVIGLTGLAFYLATLNYWLSLKSLGTVARQAGWLWQSETGWPLSLVLFAPLRLLPAAWLPGLTNLLTAISAALVLQQLARSVAILRQDVASADPLRKNKIGPAILTGPLAWVPPAFAAAICGLQPGFWEHATAATGEMLSLLCFAGAFRCVLEFRLAPQDRWLYRGALAFAVGMTDHWLMIGYLPAFLAAIIWVKGYGNCLSPQFLARLTGAALLGLSLYLLVPTLLWATAPESGQFWPALKTTLAAQKNALETLRQSPLRLLLLTAILPFVLLAVRWRSHTVQLADDTHIGVFFSKATGHFIHTTMLLAALWVACDVAIVPRSFAAQTPLLPYHYTWALVAGYCLGYLLLFGRTSGSHRPARWAAWAALTSLGLLPVLLVWKNYGTIRLTNGGALREFARQLCDDLPTGKVTVLSDEPHALLLAHAELVARGRAPETILVDTRSLRWPEYHRHLWRSSGGRWPETFDTNRFESLTPARILAGVQQIATNEALVYLHPSSGFFLEAFIATPRGWIQLLEPRTPDEAAQPTVAATTIAATESLWQARWTNQLAERAAQIDAARTRATRWAQPTFKPFQLASRPNETAGLLAGSYSKVLNHWGVQAQRAGLRTEAELWFQRALVFEPDNLAARINLEFATRRRAGETNRLTLAWLRELHPTLFNRYERWADLISRNGPVDEPTALYHTGMMYLATANPRQALAAFARSSELAPDWVAPTLAQAKCRNLLGQYAAALTLTEPAGLPTTDLNGLDWAQWLEARGTALWELGRTNEAVTVVNKTAAAHRDQLVVLLSAANFLANASRFADEVQWRETLRRQDPKRLDWIIDQGYAELRAGRAAAAFATLTEALVLEPTNVNARLFRAVAALQAGKLQEARQDYEKLLLNPETAARALFGLGDIAWQEGDTNGTIQYYQAFLTNSMGTTPQTALANQRLRSRPNE